MDEQEIDVLLNKTTKLVLRGCRGRNILLEIRRTVHNPQFGHGWLIESSVFLDPHHIIEMREALGLLIQSPQQASEVPLW